MDTRKITSLQHPLIKHFVKLHEKKSYRLEQGTVFVLGRRIIETIYPKVEVKHIVALEPSNSGEKELLVTPEILKKISGTPSPEPIGAEVVLPKSQKISGNFLLALDRISDPGNLGTLLRTAYAFGVDGVFLTSGCADPFNGKAIRAAKGASFLIPFQQGSEDELLTLCQNRQTYVADLGGKPVEKPQHPSLLILGNESHGPSPTLTSAGQKVTIPMKRGIDSLNVAIAGAILLNQMRAT